MEVLEHVLSQYLLKLRIIQLVISKNIKVSGPWITTKVVWLGFWSSIASCVAAFLSGHFADRLTGHFKSSLLILLGIATLSFIWMGLICMKVIPFSLGKYLDGQKCNHFLHYIGRYSVPC